MKGKENIYLEIVEFENGIVSQRFDMTDKSAKDLERLDNAINRQSDHERFYTREKRSKVKYS